MCASSSGQAGTEQAYLSDQFSETLLYCSGLNHPCAAQVWAQEFMSNFRGSLSWAHSCLQSFWHSSDPRHSLILPPGPLAEKLGFRVHVLLHTFHKCLCLQAKWPVDWERKAMGTFLTLLLGPRFPWSREKGQPSPFCYPLREWKKKKKKNVPLLSLTQGVLFLTLETEIEGFSWSCFCPHFEWSFRFQAA